MELVKIERRGRPNTGRKQTKHINFLLEDEIFEFYDKKAREVSGLSIHSFLKKNIDKVFGTDIESEECIIKLVKENGKLKKKLKDIKKTLADQLADMYID